MIDREFEQMGEEHMKSMTKPEGPAQEPQVTMHRHLVKDERCDICDNRPATPAPSQPAGAREWRETEELRMLRPKGKKYSAAEVDIMLATFLTQQTAAKDAEHDKHIAEFQQAIYETCKAVALECGQPDHAIDGAGSDGDEIEFTVTEVKQAFNLLRESKVAAERERDSLREQLRTAEEAFDRMATCEDDESEEYVTAWDALGAALKAGKDGQQ